jgi:hypothetical protein
VCGCWFGNGAAVPKKFGNLKVQTNVNAAVRSNVVMNVKVIVTLSGFIYKY